MFSGLDKDRYLKGSEQSFQNHPQAKEMESKMRKSYGGIFAFQAFLLILAYLILIQLNFRNDESE
jgi:hypothetical protein